MLSKAACIKLFQTCVPWARAPFSFVFQTELVPVLGEKQRHLLFLNQQKILSVDERLLIVIITDVLFS